VIERVAEEPKPLLHPNLAAVCRRRVAALIDSMVLNGRRAQAMELIRTLVNEVRLTPEEGRRQVARRGKLAKVLGLCEAAGKQKAGGGTARLERFPIRPDRKPL
jgi:hypothetical protein